MEGIVRVGCAVPRLHLAHVEANVEEHLRLMQQAAQKQAALVVFPELSLTGYTCGDLFFQRTLLEAAERGLQALISRMPSGMTAVVGAPLRAAGSLYNCAVVITRGGIRGVVPKTYLPNNGEFYEKRWFHSPAQGQRCFAAVCGQEWLLSDDAVVLESADGVTFGVELCEDLWSPLPPSTKLALGGA